MAGVTSPQLSDIDLGQTPNVDIAQMRQVSAENRANSIAMWKEHLNDTTAGNFIATTYRSGKANIKEAS